VKKTGDLNSKRGKGEGRKKKEKITNIKKREGEKQSDFLTAKKRREKQHGADIEKCLTFRTP